MWTEEAILRLFESYRREILYFYEFSFLLRQLEVNLPAKHISAFRTSPNFFLCIRRALTTACCLWVRKLFLDKKDERNLHSLLNVVEQSKSMFSAEEVRKRTLWLDDEGFESEFVPLSLQEIREDRQTIKETQLILKPVTDAASMYHAHNDKSIFHSLEGVGTAGSDVLLFDKAYDVASGIVKKYWQKWDLTDRWHYNPQISDVERLLSSFAG